MRSLLFMLGVGGVGYGVVKYFMTQYEILHNSELKISGLRIKEKTKERVTLGVKLQIKNNSETSFTVKRYDIDIFVNNVLVGNVYDTGVDTSINGHGETSTIAFDFSFSPKQFGLVDFIHQWLKTKSQTTVTYRGKVGVQKGYFTVGVPLDITYTLKELIGK